MQAACARLKNQPIIRRRAFAAASLAGVLGAAVFFSSSALAHGAFAVGADHRADGSWTLTVGIGTDYRNPENAETRAMQECMMPNRGNLPARASCRIVTTFTRRCFAIAVDTETGSYGWSILPKVERAEQAAVESCTDRGGHRQFCKVSHFGCDRRP